LTPPTPTPPVITSDPYRVIADIALELFGGSELAEIMNCNRQYISNVKIGSKKLSPAKAGIFIAHLLRETLVRPRVAPSLATVGVAAKLVEDLASCPTRRIAALERFGDVLGAYLDAKAAKLLSKYDDLVATDAQCPSS
jgi:hypothetical protein